MQNNPFLALPVSGRVQPNRIDGLQRQPAPRTSVQAASDEVTLRDGQLANQNADLQRRLLEEQLSRARLEREAAERDYKAGGLTPIQITERNDRRQKLPGFEESIMELRGLYDQYLAGDKGGVFGLGGSRNITGYLPDLLRPSNQTFRDKSESLLGPIASIQGMTGGEMNSLAALRGRFGPMLPGPSDNDETIEIKLRGLEDMANEQRRILGSPPRDFSAEQFPEAADRTRQIVTDPSAERQQLSRGTRSIEDPTLRALGTRISQMLTAGATDAEILNFMSSAGVNPASTNIRQSLRVRRTPEYRQWQKQNPGKSFPLGKSFYTREVPLDPIANAVNNAAQSDAGAFVMNAGNAVTGNQYANLADLAGGDDAGAQVRAGMDLTRAEHPWASFTGDVAGQAGLEFTLGRLSPALAAFAATPLGRRVADFGYGALAGTGEEDALSGGVTGGLANFAGGGLGRRVQRGIGAAATGIRDEGLRYLNDRGVDLTIGEIARAGKGAVPRKLAGVEDRLRGFSGTGDIIRGADERGFESFNRAAFDEGLAPIGGNNGGRTGPLALENMGNEVIDGYERALSGVTVQQDKAYRAAEARALAQGVKNPRLGKDFKWIYDNEIKPLFGPNGELTGENLQTAILTIRRQKAAYASKKLGPAFGAALDTLEDALTGMVRRQAPGVMPAFEAANKAYRAEQILTKATQAAEKQPDQLFTPAQLDQASVTNARGYGVAAGVASRPYFELGEYGQKYLPSKVPDNGNAGRAPLVPGGFTAGGATIGGAIGDEDRVGSGAEGAGYGLLGAAALALPYSKAGQRAIQSLFFTPRPAKIEAVGGLLQQYPWLGGLLGSAAGRDLALYPELEPR